MASNQPTQALNVVPSDTINIPEPDAYITGTSNSVTGTTITDLNANFLGVNNPGNTGYSNRVAIGDVVYVYASPTPGAAVTIVTVTAVTNNTTIVVSASVTGNKPYEIYRSNAGPSDREGFSLFVGDGGTAANIAVVPASSDQVVLLENVPDSSFIPLQVKRVNSTGTTATKIIALR
jgi:hypothetical protein